MCVQEVFQSNRFPLRLALLFSVALPLLGGCSDGLPKRVPVKGRVTIDGEPLTHGYIRFFPSEGRMSGGSFDEEGYFSLSCFEPGDGALVGEHKIAILAQEPLGETKMRWHAPKKYSNPATSDLRETIDSPTESIEIELTWGKKKGPFIESM